MVFQMSMEVVGADDYENLPSAGPVAQMVGGAFAGVMEHCLVYPLDSVKTRMQSLRSQTGVLDTLWQMVRKEGLARPVRGMPAVVLGAGPAHAAYFVTYENLRDVVRAQSRVPDVLAPGVAGVVATLVHDALMTPADAIKQRMQMYASPFSSCVQCARVMLRHEGAAAFYRAYTTQLSMNVPFQSIHFICYEQMQCWTNRERAYSPGAHMLSGAVAGGAAAAITTPLDVCKTLLNTQETRSGGRGRALVGLGNAVRCVYAHGGLSGFMRGLQARVVYQIPSTAICWTVYESMKFVLSDTATFGRSDKQGGGGTGSTSISSSSSSSGLSVSRICPSVSFTTAKAHPATDNT